jgi:hypothetical protein
VLVRIRVDQPYVTPRSSDPFDLLLFAGEADLFTTGELIESSSLRTSYPGTSTGIPTT